MTHLNDRLRQARLARGLSQEDLARRLGLVSMSISRYERGVSSPRLSRATAIAAELGVSLDWLIRGEGAGPDASTGRRAA